MVKTETLEAAFRATIYRVESPDSVFDLRIGVSSPEFDDFLSKQGFASWGIVTAFNPGGIRCDKENPLRHQRLMDRLQSCHWTYLPSFNLADDDTWPAEPGYILLQAGEDEVCKLAAEFFQLAYVYGNVGSVTRLVWI